MIVDLTTAQTEIAFMQFALLFGTGLIFSLLAIFRRTVVTSAVAAVMWFAVAAGNLVFATVITGMETVLTIVGFGLGTVFLVVTVYFALTDIATAASEHKQRRVEIL